MTPFHLAIPVHSLRLAAAFYENALGCARGRSSDRWIDYEFYGHQLVVHEVMGAPAGADTSSDGEIEVPVPHFGVVLTLDAFSELEARLRRAGVTFAIPPRTRFAGKPGEQRTMFVRDPSGNALEFKAFADMSMLFAH